jgi:hypothetical protein
MNNVHSPIPLERKFSIINVLLVNIGTPQMLLPTIILPADFIGGIPFNCKHPEGNTVFASFSIVFMDIL